MAPPRDDFAAVRPVRRLNRLTQALLAVALALHIGGHRERGHLAGAPFGVRVECSAGEDDSVVLDNGIA